MRICVCGSGTMGSGIAQVAASAGFDTMLYDLNQDLLDAAKRKLVKDLEVLAGKQKITEEKKRNILELIHLPTSYPSAKETS